MAVAHFSLTFVWDCSVTEQQVDIRCVVAYSELWTKTGGKRLSQTIGLCAISNLRPTVLNRTVQSSAPTVSQSSCPADQDCLVASVLYKMYKGEISSPFADFVRDHLLNTGIVNGVLVATQHGETVYSQGELKNLSQGDIDQFLDLFSRRNASTQNDFCQSDISIPLQSHGKMVYKVFQKSFTSMYATSCRNRGGLVACNLPYGVLICVYLSPGRAGDAIKTTERFCDMLKR